MSPIESFKLFSQFPLDIQRLVFEEAFEASHRKATDIALVSKAVKSWYMFTPFYSSIGFNYPFRIEPLMYQCITLNRHTYTESERRRFQLFATTFKERLKPGDFYTKYVRKVFIDDLQKWDLAEEFLPLCSNMESLACWANPDTANQITLHSLLSPEAPYLACLRRLSIYWECLPLDYRSFYHPIFKNLTHLDIDFSPEISWASLSSLQYLTYFNLDCIATCLNDQSVQEIATNLEDIIHLVTPHLPINLLCFVILIPSTIIGHVVTDEADRGCTAQQIIHDIGTGEYDARIVLGSSPGIPESLCGDKEQQRIFMRQVLPVPYDLSAWTYLPRGHTEPWTHAEDIIMDRKRASRSNPQEKGRK
ncbi:hypothetical protein D9756_006292 [Leucocoprinus leucothites]|uniref:Uncharacterized protein n=1 Tax=Leucocoprinus leucothites TaxID=201217 RepID=A0A8H5D2G2_9AGAR|nr:hypothetical protein D9756_006292 [Leucoagaricus leucothites]